MGRLNVSIPSDLAPLVSKWRRRINLSEICSEALRAELLGIESHRSPRPLVAALRQPTELEAALAARYGLADVLVDPEPHSGDRQLRQALGRLAAEYLNQRLGDGSVLAVAGGRQSWCVVENMGPRNIEVTIQALGYRQNDPQVLNAHPNTLTTLLWLLFSPRATARLVGSDPHAVVDGALPLRERPTYFVIGSCAPFARDCPLARLLAAETTEALLSAGVRGDVLYNFFDAAGRPVDAPAQAEQSVLSRSTLGALSARADSRVVLVAGGSEKAELIRRAMEAQLCNVLITDAPTARRLLGTRESNGRRAGGRQRTRAAR
jgi:DNA-binding transcriptional regulator LsrR (DeoR family)